MIKPIWAAVGGFALLGTAGGIGVLIGTGGGEEEAVQQVQTASPSTSTAATPTASAVATPQPTTGETPVPVPNDWQTYDDPKGRFSIRVPPDWSRAYFSTEDNPVWLRLGQDQKVDGELTDGVRLQVGVQAKHEGETMESVVTDSPELSTVTMERLIINERTTLRVLRRSDASDLSQLVYVFERGNDWIVLVAGAAGPHGPEYIRLFDEVIIRSFVIL